MDEIEEIVQTLTELQQLLDDLVVRGLRAADAAMLSRLRAMRDEMARISAAHMSQRLETLVDAIESDDSAAAAALLYAQSSLQLFERVLTRDVVVGSLEGLVTAGEDSETESFGA